MITTIPAPPSAAVIRRALGEFRLPAYEDQVLVRRYEELGEEIAPLDFVCSRALGEYGAFLEWAHSERIAAKQVILWIGARDLEEIQKIAGWDWRDPIPVPHSLRRLLLVGTKKLKSEVVLA